jgi:hypothetical protein
MRLIRMSRAFALALVMVSTPAAAPASQSGAASALTAEAFNAADIRDVSVTIGRRNECGYVVTDPTNLDQCPTYLVVVRGNGLVTYEGQGGVKTLGQRTHTIDAAAVRAIRTEVERADFFSLADSYTWVPGERRGSMVSIDHRVKSTITVAVGTRLKQVVAFFGTPARVWRLKQEIDRLAGIYPYTGLESRDYRTNPEGDADTDAVRTGCRASFEAAESAVGVPVRTLRRAPKLVTAVAPSLPAAQTITADVTVSLVVTVAETGAVSDARACIGDPPFAQAAIDAVRQWKYEPFLVDGRARATVIGVRIEFKPR